MALFRQKNQYRRRGAVMVFAVVTIFVLIGFASLTLDVGAMYNTRADLQNAADAAAMSGASMLASNLMLQARISKQISGYEMSSEMYGRASEIAIQLGSFGAGGTHLDADDVKTGWLDLASTTSDLDVTKPETDFNAVHVTARRSEGNANGALTFFFASIFGQNTTDISASATAAYDDRLAGYNPGEGPADLWPFSINLNEYNKQLEAGNDIYEYDYTADSSSPGSDGMPEVDIYPAKLAPGNFGLLNIGNGNNASPNLSEDIENGVTPEDLENEIGTPYLNFFDDDGNAIIYSIKGNPGLKSTLEKDIEKRIGDVVAVPVHNTVTGTGDNSVYTVVGVRFIRVMGVELNTGKKGFWLQPVSYSSGGVIINPAAPSSGGAGGRLVLAR